VKENEQTRIVPLLNPVSRAQRKSLAIKGIQKACLSCFKLLRNPEHVTDKVLLFEKWGKDTMGKSNLLKIIRGTVLCLSLAFVALVAPISAQNNNNGSPNDNNTSRSEVRNDNREVRQEYREDRDWGWLGLLGLAGLLGLMPRKRVPVVQQTARDDRTQPPRADQR
jgi:hypothetical protein